MHFYGLGQNCELDRITLKTGGESENKRKTVFELHYLFQGINTKIRINFGPQYL